MSIADSVDQLFAPDPDRWPALGDRVIYRMSGDLDYAAVIAAASWPGDTGQRLVVFHPNGPMFNVSAAQGDGVGAWRYAE